MRALIQRVSEARVEVEETTWGSIQRGLCVFVGVTHSDSEATARKLAAKLWNLRIFEDEAGQMNRSAADDGHELLIVSQFTLYGDATKGRRPSFIDAARPEQAEPLIEAVVDELKSLGATVATGKFRADMQVSLVNDGPITISMEL